ncbi:MAG: KH domain-containing protein [Patescibacteria group bacterium]|jgi:predicted RNA-binding protein YlqC (UPF0109 family)|nr:KH domain-containing protein [Patescibacteria group bacterium]
MTPEEFVTTIVREMVKNPDSVSVETTRDKGGMICTVKVADEDAKLIIGRRGKTITLIKDLVYIFGARRGERVNVILDVPDKPRN